MALQRNATLIERNMIEGGGGRGEAIELKKGLWTREEDVILTRFVMENGERNWNDLQRKYGLMRCGQSCRRRWFNNLRSNLKKGYFSIEEECKILRLHAKYGNKWALIALHLPGRSDNEIKNYWNIRRRRHIRVGLPIYPPQILSEMLMIQLEQQQQQQQQQTPQNDIHNFPLPPSSSSSSSSPSPPNQEIPNFIPIDSNHTLINMIELHHHNNGVATMPPPPPPTMQVLPSNLPIIPHFDQTEIEQFDMNPSPKTNDVIFLENFEMEIPSIQSSSSSSIVVPSNGEDNFNMAPEYCSNVSNGLLEDILNQSAALCSSHPLPSNEDKQSQVNFGSDFDISGFIEAPWAEWSSMSEKEQGDDVEDLINSMYDDSWSWLDFPTTEPAKVSDVTMAATTQAETDRDLAAEVELSPGATIPADADLDWAQEIMADSPIPFTPIDQQDHECVFDYAELAS